MSIAEFESP